MLEILPTDRFVPLDTLIWQLHITHRLSAYVDCDDNCQAPRFPVLPEDYIAAYIHWRFHARDGGCAHGC
jgi:hypothetical protein